MSRLAERYGIDIKNVEHTAVALIASEYPEILRGGVPWREKTAVLRNEIIAHLESLGCTGIQTAMIGYNNKMYADWGGTITHAVAFVPPPSVDLNALKTKLYTNDTAKGTGFCCVTLEPPATATKVAA